ncbi:sulfurtransferase complex subunit TusC [Vibrio sp. S4M6]|uniref:sulfurtransferase complex subunit TusC n=1 Tax=Vibrio sinus TaxID=2946865 RepID=UPI00202A09E8|nr:sulfurtransferase complex subunit TusC [Vibrio sinus]MCL9783858.1 sulfurtransferase complex subunit TusC [Vibrio sinus]
MKSLGFVFKSLPHSVSSGREGLDALLAASAYCEHIQLFFVGGAVAQLLEDQQPDKILSRDYSATFKLMELYDIEDVYVCQDSLDKMGLSEASFVIDVQTLPAHSMAEKIHHCDVVLTF